MVPIIYYIKTANQKYDRIISIDSFSIVRYLFSNYKEHENNAEIIKVLDKNEIITLCVIASKNLKKGDIIYLDNNLLLNYDLTL